MALTDDQRAMLRLLAQREEGYEDMAALMGLSVEEVRARVKEALSDLEGAEARPTSSPSGPAEEEPAVEAEESKPETPSPTPDADQPPPPPPSPPPPSASTGPTEAAPTQSSRARPPRRPTGSRPRLSLPEDRGARFGLAAGAAVVVLTIILLATGVLGGEDDSGSDGSAGLAAQDAPQLTQAVLEPTDGSDARGRALFGRAGKQVVLQVEAEGLEPSPSGQSYVVWLARSPRQMLPLAATKVDDSGEIAARYQVPGEVLAFLASGSFDQISISLISDKAFRQSLTQARRRSKAPAFTGDEVLRGEISGPIVGLARRAKR